MTSFVLRLIAMIAMLIDHTAYVFVPAGSAAYNILRALGRVALPIFAFLIAEGYVHSHSRLRYALRLAVFAVISEIPFDFAFHRCVLEFDRKQNVFFTLLLGMLALVSMGSGARYALSWIPQFKKYAENTVAQMLVASPVIVACGWLAERINSDYGWVGVAFICAFYVFREQRAVALLFFAALNIFGLCFGTRLAVNVLGGRMFYFKKTLQWYALLATVPLSSYNGEPGSKKLKYMFYCFYPAHLILLGTLSMVLRG